MAKVSFRPFNRSGHARPLQLWHFEYSQSFPRDFATTLQLLEEVQREAPATLFDGSTLHLGQEPLYFFVDLIGLHLHDI